MQRAFRSSSTPFRVELRPAVTSEVVRRGQRAEQRVGVSGKPSIQASVGRHLTIDQRQRLDRNRDDASGLRVARVGCGHRGRGETAENQGTDRPIVVTRSGSAARCVASRVAGRASISTVGSGTFQHVWLSSETWGGRFEAPTCVRVERRRSTLCSVAREPLLYASSSHGLYATVRRSSVGGNAGVPDRWRSSACATQVASFVRGCCGEVLAPRELEPAFSSARAGTWCRGGDSGASRSRRGRAGRSSQWRSMHGKGQLRPEPIRGCRRIGEGCEPFVAEMVPAASSGSYQDTRPRARLGLRRSHGWRKHGTPSAGDSAGEGRGPKGSGAER